MLHPAVRNVLSARVQGLKARIEQLGPENSRSHRSMLSATELELEFDGADQWVAVQQSSGIRVSCLRAAQAAEMLGYGEQRGIVVRLATPEEIERAAEIERATD